MSLNFGRSLLAIPGPSVIPERVLAAMHRPSPNIYAGELIDLTASLFPDLKTVAQTKHDAVIYISNGHGVWEAALANTLNPGDKVLVISTGRFAYNWGKLGEARGLDIDVLDFGMQSDADPNLLEDVLRKDENHQIKAVLTVQTDTATSVINDIAALRQAIDNAGHPALYMVDCIASLGCDRYLMDQWGVDVTVAACQKGLMTPTGLGILYFNDKAVEARKRADPGEYWDWARRVDPEVYYQRFDGTAPTHHLYGMREALNILVHEEGIENTWNRHKTIANAYWAAVDAWNLEGSLVHNIEDKSKRSHAVSALRTSEDFGGRIQRWCEEEAGLTLGIGLGIAEPGTPAWEQCFRIGHMGHQNVVSTMGVMGSMDAAMKAVGMPHGDGALVAASKMLAGHSA